LDQKTSLPGLDLCTKRSFLQHLPSNPACGMGNHRNLLICNELPECCFGGHFKPGLDGQGLPGGAGALSTKLSPRTVDCRGRVFKTTT
jgi:hypothetical protein